ncbi:HHIP-like protein 1 [Mactra antiquata]
MANEVVYVNFILVYLLLFLWHGVNSHPQCLDSRPPFQSNGNLTFCTDYVEFGCCTQSDDLDLQYRFSRLESTISAADRALWARCSHYAKTFLCQTCSPYAAHIFDSEQNQYKTNVVQRVFPGLCRGQCSAFYQQCKDLVSYYMFEASDGYQYTEQTRLDTAIKRGEAQFCSAILLSDNDYCYPELLTNPILNGNISIEKVTGEGCICLQPFSERFRNPVFLKHANDGSNRLFIGEQIGLIHIMYTNGTVLPYPFLDLQFNVKTSSGKGDERGLLGMEFHPNFSSNGKLYVYYSSPLSAYERSQSLGDHKIRVVEFKVNPNRPNEVDAYDNREILKVYQPWWNHNGGEILFGDDGYLYIFIGDGGRAGDPLNSGQDMYSMLGKVHRIDVDRADPIRRKQYSIPPDNPFADGIKGLPEIYAFGVRNIWRCGKDRGDRITKHGKGRILCGDVGQGDAEEIDLIEKGANYGWKIKEGSLDYCAGCKQALKEIPLTEPVWDYGHDIGKSVTGGHFYRGCESPNFNGFYFYGDFMTGRIFRLTEPKNPKQKRWDNKEIKMCGSNMCKPPLISDYFTSIISFGEDEAGEVYMLSTSFASTSSYSGSVYKLVDPHRRGHPEQCKTAREDVTVSPKPVTEITTETPTKPFKTVPTIPTVKDNSGSSVKITPTATDKKQDYLDYLIRLQRRNSRRKLQRQFKEERQKTLTNLMTYRGDPPTQYPKDYGIGTISRSPELVFHGIDVQQCTRKPRFWCSLNRLYPSN